MWRRGMVEALPGGSATKVGVVTLRIHEGQLSYKLRRRDEVKILDRPRLSLQACMTIQLIVDSYWLDYISTSPNRNLTNQHSPVPEPVR